MPRKWLLLLLAALALTYSCSQPDDQVIREQLALMEQESERADWPAVLSHISRHYKDSDENNYFMISQMVKNYTKGVGELQVEIEVLGVKIAEKEARSQIKLVVKGSKAGSLYYVVGTDQAPEYPELWWAKERGDWKLIRVEGIEGDQESPW